MAYAALTLFALPIAAQSGARAAQLPLSARQPGGTFVQQSVQIPSGSTTTVQVQTQGSYAGSIAGKDEPNDALPLTLAEAVARGIRTNLGLISASNGDRQARAQRDIVRSALLPNLNGSVSEVAAKIDLAAQGFSAGTFGSSIPFAFPQTAGPFHYYDLHGSIQQSIVDVTAIRNLRSQNASVEASGQQARQAREEVVLAVAGIYLQLMADTALLERQRAEVTLAEASYKQAQAQADAGNKSALEASRSLIELQTEQQRLRAQQGQVEKRQIQLARLIGLPLKVRVSPVDRLAPLPNAVDDVDKIVRRALAQRPDLHAAQAQVRAAVEARKAASAEHLPSVTVSGQYGLQGTNPNHGAGVFQAQAGISIPIFQGGRIEADVRQADAVVSQRQADLVDQQGAVEADVRSAYVDLTVANDQVNLADRNRELAMRTLQQSRDRFDVGVADSVEVVNSQQALAAADHDLVSSLFAQHVALINLAHASGDAEKEITELFRGEAK